MNIKNENWDYNKIHIIIGTMHIYLDVKSIASPFVPGKLTRVAAAEDSLDQHSTNMRSSHIPAIIAGAGQVHLS